MAVANPRSKTYEKALEMSRLLSEENEFVVTDLETSGFSPDKGGRIIEIAAVKVKNGEIIDTFHELINPGLKVSAKVTELTGITNEMLLGKPSFGNVLPLFFNFLGNAVFVAHNANFDWDRFLIPFFKKVGIIANNQVICTKILAGLYVPQMPKHGLADLCVEAGVELENHHRALSDAKATAGVLLYFKKAYADKYAIGSKQKEIVEQTDLFGATSQTIVMPETSKTNVSSAGFKVKRVSYWEKDVSKQKKMQRIYILLSCGSVFYDLSSNAWYNKDVKEAVDFVEVSNRVLSFLNLDDMESFKRFRGSKQ